MKLPTSDHPETLEHVFVQRLLGLQELVVILAADHVVELGPGSGERGGEIVFAGPQAEFRKSSPFVMLYQQIETAALRGNIEGFRIGSTSDSTYLFNVSKK